MLNNIANIILGYIDDLPFMDRTSGVVRKITVEARGANETIKKNTFPVGCDVNPEECIAQGKYNYLTPDSRYKSVHYFEDIGGARFVQRSGDRYYYEARLRLVGWLNGQKLGRKEDCYLSADAIMNIVKALPDNPTNHNPFSTLEFSTISEVKKDAGIFPYTYDEPKTQYLMHPYDYYALDFLVTYNVHRSCIGDFEVNPETC